jgi:general secretion pathway protein F
MSVFAYRALTTTGRTASGVVAADSARQAWETLRARGVYPTELRPGGAGAATRRRGAGRAEVAGFFAQLAMLVGGGLPVDDALGAAVDSATFPALGSALTEIGVAVAGGDGLGDALARFPDLFSPAAVALVRAGEASGHLADSLARLAEDHEHRAERRRRLLAALTYPAVTATVAVAVLGFLAVWVLPQMAELFEQTGAAVPPATRLLLGVATVVERSWWAFPVAVAVALLAGPRVRRHPAMQRQLGALLARVPVLGPLRRDAAVARVQRTLALLLQARVPLDESLGLAAPAAQDPAVGGAVARARAAVRRGDAMTPALSREGLLTATTARVLAAGERTGRLAEALAQAAKLQEADVARRLDRLAALFEPALVLVMGGAVLVVVLTVLVPLLGLEP